MSGFDADFFDGKTSKRHRVRAELLGHLLGIRGDDVSVVVPRDEVIVWPRVGSTPVRIGLPDGGLLVAPDFEAVDATLSVPKARTLAYRLESHALFVVVAFIGIIVAGAFAYIKGIPWAAEKIAMHIPPGVESQLSTETLAAFDKFMLKASKLEDAEKNAIVANFNRLKAATDVPADTHLEFRDAQGLGANAFTLPGGVIIVTDALVDLLDDKEIDAVLAHELGHVHHRHGTRLVIGNSAHVLIVMAVFGDASSVASAAALAPTALLTTGYSRDFEREADAFAFDLLKRTGGTPADFASALRALESDSRKKHPIPMQNGGYLSTHPDSGERIGAAEAAAGNVQDRK